MDAFLRSEIQSAFQDIVLPQIQKDLSALKEDVQDMRRDLRSFSSGRDSENGRTLSCKLSPRVVVEHFPAPPGPGRDTVGNSDSSDLPHGRQTSADPWKRSSAFCDPREHSSPRVPRSTNKATSLIAFKASNAKKRDDEDTEECRRRFQTSGAKQHLAPPHYISEDDEDSEDGESEAEVSEVRPPPPIVGRPETPAEPEPSLVVENPRDSTAFAVPRQTQPPVAELNVEGQDRTSRGSGGSQLSPGGGKSSVRERSSQSPTHSPGHFGPSGSVYIQKRTRIQQGSTRGSVRAGQSLYKGRVSLAIAKAEPRKPTFMEWVITLTKPETYRGISAAAILSSFRFDNMISLLILGNSITIGLEADFAARNSTDNPPLAYRVIEVFFCVVFTTELLLRVYVHKRDFFLKREMSVLWNYFDLLVVSAQLVQECFEYMQSNMQSGASADNDAGNLRILRVLRVLRIVRIFRLVRVLHLISELRTIVSSIIGSFRSLFWTVLLLLLMMYIYGVWLLQTVTDHFLERTDFDSNGAFIPYSLEEETLHGHFASLGGTIIKLWQALSGGVDWSDVGDPLMTEIDWIYGVAFAAFIAFSLLALMNVVTGVFVQTALSSAEREEENFLTDQIIGIFHKCKREETRGCITEKDLDERLQDPEMAKEWKNISVSADEAKYVFALLDVDETGEVQFEEFLSACLRLRGSAKSLDMLIQLQESRQTKKVLEDALANLQEHVERITSSVQERVTRVEQTMSFKAPKQLDGHFENATPSTSEEEV